MSTEIEHARDEQVLAAFAVLLTHSLKLEISRNGELWIERLSDGRYRVLQMRTTGRTLEAEEEIFEEVRSAAGYFLDIAEGRAGK